MPSAATSSTNVAEASSSKAAPSPTLYVKNIEGKVKKPGTFLPFPPPILSSRIPLTNTFHSDFLPPPLESRTKTSAPLAFLHLRSCTGRSSHKSSWYERPSIHRI